MLERDTTDTGMPQITYSFIGGGHLSFQESDSLYFLIYLENKFQIASREIFLDYCEECCCTENFETI